MDGRRKAMAIYDLYTKPYSISYHLNGGELASENPSSYSIQTSEFILNAPTRDGYEFLGWTQDNQSQYVFSSPFGSYGDRTYTAHWGMIMTEEDVSSNVLNLTIDVAADSDGDGIPDEYHVSFTGSSHIENINIPIENLIAGQKYRLTFTESNNATNGNSSGYWTAMYGCYVDSAKHTELSTSFKEESRSQGGLIAEWIGSADGHLNVIDGKNLNGSRNVTVEFTATASTMYWVWNYGLIQDGTQYTYHYTNIVVEPVVPQIQFSQMALKDDTTYVATYEVTNCGERNLTFTFDGNSGVEILYYPITGLTSGTTYTITFNHKFSGAFINGSGGTYDYGCGVCSDISSAVLANKMSGITSNWLSNTWTMHAVTGSTESVTLTFTATASTAYWIWNMGNVSDSTIATVDLAVTKFSAKHKAGGTITY